MINDMVANFEKIFQAPRDKLFQTIVNYNSYPEFLPGCKRIQLLTSSNPFHVLYTVEALGKEFSYELLHKEEALTYTVQWSLIKSNFFKTNEGSWKLTEMSKAQTKVEYSFDLELAIILPAFIVNAFIKKNLDVMLQSFEKRALLLK